MILVGQLLVQLDDAVEAVPGQVAGCAGSCRRLPVRSRQQGPQPGQRAVAVEQVGRHRIVRYAISVQNRIGRSGKRRGLRCLAFGANQEPLMLAAEEEERLVLPDWAAY
jgi:hypothetical protein